MRENGRLGLCALIDSCILLEDQQQQLNEGKVGMEGRHRVIGGN
jgi:hypothetical protein